MHEGEAHTADAPAPAPARAPAQASAPAPAPAPRRVYALVPCAGSGERAGTAGPKQYAPLAGRPLVAHTLEALLAVPAITAVLVVLAPEDRRFEAMVPFFTGRRAWRTRVGGPTRAATVAAGLWALGQRGAREDDLVLVHDAARCLVRPAWIERLLEAVADEPAGGLLALPVADTLKAEVPPAAAAEPIASAESDAGPTPASAEGGAVPVPSSAEGGAVPAPASAEGGAVLVPSSTEGDAPPPPPRVGATVPRGGKWMAQTPQCFALGLLTRALELAGPDVTDESSAVEALGLAPRLVRGDMENLKVTWPEDFHFAERLLATREAAPLPPAPAAAPTDPSRAWR
jgi:2-C-methyl-D-erythritol 4-phosphate cytidylyltransferase